MSRVITALFQNGVLKPLQNLHLKEQDKIEIKIHSHDEWEKLLNLVIENIHERAKNYSQEEIESDLSTEINKSLKKG